MNLVRFQARDAAHAIEQIHSQLGAEAVVLSVAPLPATGLGRLWRKPRLDVLAALATAEDNVAQAPPAAASAPALPPEPIEEPDATSDHQAPLASLIVNSAGPADLGGNWRTATLLREIGLQPLCLEQVFERVSAGQGEKPPASFAAEFALVRRALAELWLPAPPVDPTTHPLHVFIGPPGAGKTTVLCKWLAKAVLTEGQKARAWRLDSRAANFAGLLDFYGEILGVTVEREWKPEPSLSGFDAGFVDLPGVNPHDSVALAQLRKQLEAIPGAHVHLVLNAAYDLPVLLAQARAFGVPAGQGTGLSSRAGDCARHRPGPTRVQPRQGPAIPVSDLIFTHLDEERRPGKLWNFVLGTNIGIRFLSGGQNIPGDFRPARPEMLFPR